MAVALIVVGVLWMLGIVLFVLGQRDVIPDDPRRPVRYYYPGQFSIWPTPPLHPVRIQRHSWRWHIGMALGLYMPMIAAGIVLIWLFQRLA
ncbi:MAG: hypothetical protein ACRDP1_17310 [Nocardioidaceae bacterium]